MGLFTHSCRLPNPRRKPFTWTCRCGQQWRISPCDRETAYGTATGEGTPVGPKPVKR